MKEKFNVKRSTLNVKTHNFSLGLIGFPLGHSISPKIHNAALKSHDLEGEYQLYSIPALPDGQTELVETINQVRDGKINGLNVTIPHKQNVIPLLDDLTPVAKAIGAVNTIYSVRNDDFSHPVRSGDFSRPRLIGDNTDAPGFWRDVQRLAHPTSHSALILGAGGSARAVAYALLTQGYATTIAARRIEQALEISAQYSVFSNQLTVTELKNWPLETGNWSLIVNTTPVGMHPHTDACPWPEGAPFPENSAIYDLVYNPRETLLVRQAIAAGLPAMTGLGMLVEQAALALERWTGLEAPRQAMLKAAVSNL